MIIILVRNVFAFSFCAIPSLAGEGVAVGGQGGDRDSREYEKSDYLTLDYYVWKAISPQMFDELLGRCGPGLF